MSKAFQQGSGLGLAALLFLLAFAPVFALAADENNPEVVLLRDRNILLHALNDVNNGRNEFVRETLRLIPLERRSWEWNLLFRLGSGDIETEELPSNIRREFIAFERRPTPDKTSHDSIEIFSSRKTLVAYGQLDAPNGGHITVSRSVDSPPLLEVSGSEIYRTEFSSDGSFLFVQSWSPHQCPPPVNSFSRSRNALSTLADQHREDSDKDDTKMAPNCYAFSIPHRVSVSGSLQSNPVIYDSDRARLILTLCGPDDADMCVPLSINEPLVPVKNASDDKELHTQSSSEDQFLKHLLGRNNSQISSEKHPTPDGNLVAIILINGVAEVWNLRTRKRLNVLGEPVKKETSWLSPRGAAFSPDGRLVIACPVGPKPSAAVFEWKTGRRLVDLVDNEEPGLIGETGGAHVPDTKFGFSPDGKMIWQYVGIAFSHDHVSTTAVAEASTGKKLPELSGSWDDIGWSPDSSFFFAWTSSEKLIHVFSTRTKQFIKSFRGADNRIGDAWCQAIPEFPDRLIVGDLLFDLKALGPIMRFPQGTTITCGGRAVFWPRGENRFELVWLDGRNPWGTLPVPTKN